jgi:RNA polymerase sigma factor (sigma-70 family)
MEAHDASDEELVDAYRRAAPAERPVLANQLFDRYYPRVARWCLRFTGDRESAADLTQTVFANAYRHLESFRSDARFSTWLYAITRHACLARARQAGRRHEDTDDGILADVPSPDDGPDLQAERTSDARFVHAVLAATLDDLERLVFTLHYGDDLALDQITRVLQLTNPSGAKAYIVSAKRKLARAVRRIEARGGRL